MGRVMAPPVKPGRSMTVVPGDNGDTLFIKMPGSEEVEYSLDDINGCSLPEGDKRFLRDQLQRAEPGNASCSVPPRT